LYAKYRATAIDSITPIVRSLASDRSSITDGGTSIFRFPQMEMISSRIFPRRFLPSRDSIRCFLCCALFHSLKWIRLSLIRAGGSLITLIWSRRERPNGIQSDGCRPSYAAGSSKRYLCARNTRRTSLTNRNYFSGEIMTLRRRRRSQERAVEMEPENASQILIVYRLFVRDVNYGQRTFAKWERYLNHAAQREFVNTE